MRIILTIILIFLPLYGCNEKNNDNKYDGNTDVSSSVAESKNPVVQTSKNRNETSETPGIQTSTNSNNPTYDESNLFGDWIVSQFSGYSKVSAEVEDKKLIGTKLVFSKDEVNYNNDIISNPHYKVSRLTEQEFLDWFDSTNEFVGLKADSTFLVEIFKDQYLTKKWEIPLKAFFVKDKNTIIAYHKGGMYYQLSRITK